MINIYIDIVGAGPGAPDLITVRGLRALENADTVLYAGSLVSTEHLAQCKKTCTFHDSAGMTLEEQVELMCHAAYAGKKVVRLHTGDPALYGAINEQIYALAQRGVKARIVPGVSSVFAAAASLGCQLTSPEVSQSLVLTRTHGRTPMPPTEKAAIYAKTGATLVFFLSMGNIENLMQELLTEGNLEPSTPAAIVYRASWPDELTIRGTVATLAEQAKNAGIKKHALILVGQALIEHTATESMQRAVSKLYAQDFSHGYREGVPNIKTLSASSTVQSHTSTKAGKIVVVGLASGYEAHITPEVEKALQECQTLAGYTKYIDFIRHRFTDKNFIESGMKGEVTRCQQALTAAAAGQYVCMVCSGDAGILGMAGLLFELRADNACFTHIPITVLPGITAASLAAAALGAPLQNGFSLVSLSDLLVPTEEVRQNIYAVLASALPIVLYNPAGRKRRTLFEETIHICKEKRGGHTYCAIVHHAGRQKEETWIGTLDELPMERVNMSSLVLIGGARTLYTDGALYEARGYADKYF